ncbi:phosphopantetheine-binding protein [Guyparkeria halopsychrophila]|uniref:acyl carrier protein n=1 Tax=Guyparkeria halopsychrophila TaxID=3139421 RepID=UPI0037C90BE5
MSEVSIAPDPLFHTVRQIILDTLDLPGPAQRFGPESGLFGEIPELDSMGVVLLLTALEDRFDIQLSDDEIDAEWFATFGTVTEFIRVRT